MIQRIFVDIPSVIRGIFEFMKHGLLVGHGSRQSDLIDSHNVGLMVAKSSGLATKTRAITESANPSCNRPGWGLTLPDLASHVAA